MVTQYYGKKGSGLEYSLNNARGDYGYSRNFSSGNGYQLIEVPVRYLPALDFDSYLGRKKRGASGYVDTITPLINSYAITRRETEYDDEKPIYMPGFVGNPDMAGGAYASAKKKIPMMNLEKKLFMN